MRDVDKSSYRGKPCRKKAVNHREGKGGRLDEADEQSQYCRLKTVAHEVRLLVEGRPEVESRYRKSLGDTEGAHQGQDQPKRRMPKTARTVWWEDGG